MGDRFKAVVNAVLGSGISISSRVVRDAGLWDAVLEFLCGALPLLPSLFHVNERPLSEVDLLS